MFCGKCGNQINQGEKFCGKCGAPVIVEPSLTRTTMQSTTVQSVTQRKPQPQSIAQPVTPVKKTTITKNIIIIIAILLGVAVLIGGMCALVMLNNSDPVGGGDNIYYNDDTLTDEIPGNAISYNGHRYFVYSLNGFSNWDSVEEFCSNMSGYPATISSQEENDFIYNYLLNNYPYDNVYFGLVKNEDLNIWSWSNGEKLTYINWDDESANGSYSGFSPINRKGKWKKFDSISAIYNSNAIGIKSVSATSVLSEITNVHYAERVFDNDVSTAWVEGVQGNGIGESLTINFDNNYVIDRIEINAGYQRSDEHYTMNSRPNRIKFSFSDGTSEYYNLADVNDVQYIQLNNPVVTDRVVLTLDSVYPGTYYEDTAISEIHFREYYGSNYFICEWGE